MFGIVAISAILGDTCDSSKINAIAVNADVAVREATLEDELKVCIDYGDSTPDRPATRKILQPRHYFERCTRIEFYKLLALYQADSKVVVQHLMWNSKNVKCVNSFTYFLLLHCWGCWLNLLNE